MTRRIVKVQPENVVQDSFGRFGTDNGYSFTGYIECPYGQSGDRLWVRETWRHWQVGNPESKVVYRADFDKDPGFWKSSIHMPRWASRITLEITSVRVERLQEISEADAAAEGTPGFDEPSRWPNSRIVLTARNEFRALWDKINGKRASWESNPWVWVIEFQNHL